MGVFGDPCLRATATRPNQRGPGRCCTKVYILVVFTESVVSAGRTRTLTLMWPADMLKEALPPVEDNHGYLSSDEWSVVEAQ